MRRIPPAVAAMLAILLVGGCTRGSTSSRPPIHLNPNMDRQPKLLPQAESTFFYDGAAMRPAVEGTVARGDLAHLDAVRLGLSPTGEPLARNPLPIDAAVLSRGRERYEIYCSPCHGVRGNGKGIAATRGRIPAANLLEDRFVQAPDGQIYGAIKNGVGLMAPLAARVPVADRWAIVAHVRELQSQ